MTNARRREPQGATPAQRLGGYFCVLAAVLWIMQALGAAPRASTFASAPVVSGLSSVVLASASIWSEDAADQQDAGDAADTDSSSSQSSDTPDSDDDDQNDEDDETEVALVKVGLSPLAPPPGTTLPIESERIAVTVWHSRLPRPVERA